MPKVARVKCAALTFHGPLGGPFQAVLRSLAAISDRVPVRTAPEKVHNGSVAYRVAKLEMSKFSSLELPPGAKSQNHMDAFLKTWPTRDLTAGTRRLSAVHERVRHPPSATVSSYASPQVRVPFFS